MTDVNRQSEQEFLPLFLQSQRRLFGYIVALVHDLTDAEDLLQRTSLVLWRKFEQFQPGTDFFRWSSRVAFLEVQDFLKQKRRTRVVFSSQMVSELAEVLVGESQRWESRRDALSGCIEKLRPTDRDLVEQCYAGRQSFKDVAKGLGRPENSVYQSLGRIRQTLLNCIESTLSRVGDA